MQANELAKIRSVISSVSYTHLDVYKRQPSLNLPLSFQSAYPAVPLRAEPRQRIGREIHRNGAARNQTSHQIARYRSQRQAKMLVAKSVENRLRAWHPVSYTHLDVYKGQSVVLVVI